MIDIFSLFEVMEPQGNYMEEIYNPSEYKLTCMLCCYFFYIAYLFYIYQTYIFCNSHEMHFETIENFLLWKRVSINKIIVKLVKLCMWKIDKTNCMTRYISTCSIMAMGLLYWLTLWSNVCVWALDPMVLWPKRSHSQWMVIIEQTSLAVWATHYQTRLCC